MIIVKHTSRGYAVYAYGYRLTPYFVYRAEAEYHCKRMIHNFEESQRKFDESQQYVHDKEQRTKQWIKSLRKHGRVRIIHELTHFDQKQMNIIKEQETKK